MPPFVDLLTKEVERKIAIILIKTIAACQPTNSYQKFGSSSKLAKLTVKKDLVLIHRLS